MKKIVTIGELGIIITGNTPPRSNPKLYGNYTPFIKATDISETEKYTYHPEEYYSEEGYNKYIKSLIPKGSTCVVTIGSIGKKMTMAHCDLFINQAMNAIIPNENFDNEYVYYAVKNILPNIRMLDSGTASGRENVSKSAFSKMQILIEDNIITQRRIAEILSRYDSLIENYQKQIKLLEESAQRLYKEWFVDLRFPGHENTKIVDGVPEGWEKKSIAELGSFINGFAFKPSDWHSNGLPIIKIKEMGNGISIDTPRNNGERVPEKYLVTTGDLLFSWSATLMVIVWTGENGWLNQHLFKVIPKEGISREFVLQSISNGIIEFSNLTTGSTMKHIQRNKLDQVFVNFPCAEIMQEYNIFGEALRRQIINISSQIHKLTEARDRLLPKLMSGEIEV